MIGHATSSTNSLLRKISSFNWQIKNTRHPLTMCHLIINCWCVFVDDDDANHFSLYLFNSTHQFKCTTNSTKRLKLFYAVSHTERCLINGRWNRLVNCNKTKLMMKFNSIWPTNICKCLVREKIIENYRICFIYLCRFLFLCRWK